MDHSEEFSSDAFYSKTPEYFVLLGRAMSLPKKVAERQRRAAAQDEAEDAKLEELRAKTATIPTMIKKAETLKKMNTSLPYLKKIVALEEGNKALSEAGKEAASALLDSQDEIKRLRDEKLQLQTHHSSEIAEASRVTDHLRTELTSLGQEFEGKIQEINKIESTTEAIQRSLREKLEAMELDSGQKELEYQDKLRYQQDLAKQEMSNAISQLEKTHSVTIAQIKKDHGMAINGLEAAHSEAIAEMEQRHSLELRKTNEALDQANKEAARAKSDLSRVISQRDAARQKEDDARNRARDLFQEKSARESDLQEAESNIRSMQIDEMFREADIQLELWKNSRGRQKNRSLMAEIMKYKDTIQILEGGLVETRVQNTQLTNEVALMQEYYGVSEARFWAFRSKVEGEIELLEAKLSTSVVNGQAAMNGLLARQAAEIGEVRRVCNSKVDYAQAETASIKMNHSLMTAELHRTKSRSEKAERAVDDLSNAVQEKEKAIELLQSRLANSVSTMRQQSLQIQDYTQCIVSNISVYKSLSGDMKTFRRTEMAVQSAYQATTTSKRKIADLSKKLDAQNASLNDVLTAFTNGPQVTKLPRIIRTQIRSYLRSQLTIVSQHRDIASQTNTIVALVAAFAKMGLHKKQMQAISRAQVQKLSHARHQIHRLNSVIDSKDHELSQLRMQFSMLLAGLTRDFVSFRRTEATAVAQRNHIRTMKRQMSVIQRNADEDVSALCQEHAAALQMWQDHAEECEQAERTRSQELDQAKTDLTNMENEAASWKSKHDELVLSSEDNDRRWFEMGKSSLNVNTHLKRLNAAWLECSWQFYREMHESMSLPLEDDRPETARAEMWTIGRMKEWTRRHHATLLRGSMDIQAHAKELNEQIITAVQIGHTVIKERNEQFHEATVLKAQVSKLTDQIAEFEKYGSQLLTKYDEDQDVIRDLHERGTRILEVNRVLTEIIENQRAVLIEATTLD